MQNSIWFVIFFALALYIVYSGEKSAKTRVRFELERKGFKNIRIQTKMFARGGEGSITFDVEYRDQSGLLHKNSCRTTTGFFSDDDIFWKEPLK